jgi:hypothetical protein
MKKLSFYLLGLLAMTMLSSCLSNDEPTNKQSYNAIINCRATDGTKLVFSQTTTKVEIDYTAMTIQFTGGYKDADGQSQNLPTAPMKLNSWTTTVYQFSSGEANGLKGYIDTSTGMIYFTVTPSNGTHAYCTTHLMYAYVTTTITNPDNGFHYNSESSAYLFVPDAEGKVCSMSISNFSPNTQGAVEINEVRYNGLTFTPTATGYTITASQAQTPNSSIYTITDVNITLDNQGMVINGSFKCRDLEFSLAGNLYPQGSN